MMPRPSLLLLACSLTLAVAATPVVAADPTPAAKPAADEPAGIVTTKSGLKYLETAPGEGASPKNGQTVTIVYSITADGKVIEGKNGGRSFEFTLGKGQALKGLEEGVSTMKVGGKRTLFVPPALGYGTGGVPGKVSPEAVLQIEVDLKSIAGR